MKTQRSPLFAQLTAIASAIAFSISYERDDSFRWDGDGPDPREEGFDVYDVTVSASAIVNGTLVIGSDSMGGHYEKPDERDEDLGGYLPQMLDEAAADLARALGKSGCVDLLAQIESARAHLKTEMHRRYEEQRAEFAARKA